MNSSVQIINTPTCSVRAYYKVQLGDLIYHEIHRLFEDYAPVTRFSHGVIVLGDDPDPTCGGYFSD